MCNRARKKLAKLALEELDQVVMIGDTMETDIRGAFEAGLLSFLVLSGSTELGDVGDYVYQPTQVLQSVAELVSEVKTGKASDRLDGHLEGGRMRGLGESGHPHHTDIFAFHKP